jgi:predicted nucleotidyltransferase
MISDEDRKKLLEIAKRYNVSKLYLFGSNLDPNSDAKDIDLGVEGVPDKFFFRFYAEVYSALSKPVDLVDLKKKSLFNEMIKSEGFLLYG